MQQKPQMQGLTGGTKNSFMFFFFSEASFKKSCLTRMVFTMLFYFVSMLQNDFLDVELTSGKQQRETIRFSLVLQKSQKCGFLTHLDVRYLLHGYEAPL